MAICKRDGCGDRAVAVQLVRTEHDEDDYRLLEDWCRPHHVDERRAAGVLVPVEVAGKAVIMGVDGTENQRGARIELDAEEVRIGQLVDLGFVKLVDEDPQARLDRARAEAAALEARLNEARQAEADAAAAVVADEPAAAKKVAAPAKTKD